MEVAFYIRDACSAPRGLNPFLCIIIACNTRNPVLFDKLSIFTRNLIWIERPGPTANGIYNKMVLFTMCYAKSIRVAARRSARWVCKSAISYIPSARW